MPSSPPPRYVVRPSNAREQHRRVLWKGVAWLGCITAGAIVIAVVTLVRPGRFPVHRVDHQAQLSQLRARHKALKRKNEALKQQVANLKRSIQVTQIATRSLRKTLIKRDEAISNLRADLGVYTRLLGNTTRRKGLQVQKVSMQPVTGTRAWNLSIDLTQSIRRHSYTTGTLTLNVYGLRENKVVQLAWPDLGDHAQKNGLPFHFKYFKQLHTTIMLPRDFLPTRLQVQAKADNGNRITYTITWSEALNNHVTLAQGNAHAKP